MNKNGLKKKISLKLIFQNQAASLFLYLTNFTPGPAFFVSPKTTIYLLFVSPKTALLVNDGMKTIHITLVEMHHLHQNYVQIISAQIMTESLLGATPPIRINDMMSVMSREYNKTSNVNGQ